MTIRTLLSAVALTCAAPLLAQPDVPLPPPPAVDQLETLLSPIALYPDPLVSIILPAATLPGDIAIAARFTASNPDPAYIDAQAWDDSVKAVAHYPELLTWMDQNLEWTKQLGAAFVTQPTEVMNTIQSLRQRALNEGILVDSPEQRVIVQQNYIYLEPAQPNVIYVPSYDPQIFYSPAYGYARPRSGLSFSMAFSTGPWLAFEPDWGRRSIWIDRRRDWSRRDWRPEPTTNVVVSAERQAWRPRHDAIARANTVTNSNSVTINNRVNNTRYEVAQPAPLAAPAPAPVTSRPIAQSRIRPGAPPAPQLPPTATGEPALPPTGRMTPPRAVAPQAQAVTPPAEAAEPPRGAVAPRSEPASPPTRAVPLPSAARDARGPRVPTSAPQVPTSLPPPTGPRPVPPGTISTLPHSPAPPPNAKSDQPPPKGKAKGHDKDKDDDEDGPPRGK